MPAKKGSIDKNFVNKSIQYIGDLGKSVWNSKAEDKVPYIALFGLLTLFYVKNGITTHSWTPKELFEDMKKEQMQKEVNINYKKQIEKAYIDLFKDAKNFEDSLQIYNNNPFLKDKIKLKPVYSIEEMEKAVNQSKLERKF
jgi:hypothetical protein